LRSKNVSLNHSSAKSHWAKEVRNGQLILINTYSSPKRIKNKLQSLSNPVDLVHIIDHSNSVYLPQLKKISQAKIIITCHDLIAIRTARGEFNHAPQTSEIGQAFTKVDS
jgi:hypothetical protein